MKKMILSLVIAAVTLCSCGANIIYGENNVESKPLFVTANKNCYDTGLIFTAGVYGMDTTAYYFDYETMEKIALCAVPNCTHTTASCSAKMVGDTPIVYGDYIYYFTDNQHTEETGKGQRRFVLDSRLNRMKLENSETEVVCSFDDSTPNNDEFAIINGKLYFNSNDGNPVCDEYGNVSVTSNVGGLNYMCSIDLDTFEYKNYSVIYDGDRQYEAAHRSSNSTLIGCRGDKIYILYSFLKEDYDLSRDDDDNQFTWLFFEFDTKTDELTQLEDKQVYFANDEYIAYTENGRSFISHGNTPLR